MLSIVICTRNRAAALAETLDALQQVEIPRGETAELLIVDNGSGDGTASLVGGFRWRHGEVRRIDEPRRGKGFAYNAGIGASKGGIIVFTDDDVRPPVSWLGVVCEPIQAGRAEMVAGGVELAPHLRRPWMTPVLRAFLSSTETLNPANPEWVVGANLAIRRDVFAKVPAFDTELGPGALGFEDEVLLSYQVRAAGFRVVGAFGAPVEHWFDPGRLARGALLEYAAASGRSKAYIDHHWNHRVVPHVTSATLGAWARLRWYRITHPGALGRAEGVAEREFEAARSVAYWEQFQIERHRPRAYAHHGLVKHR
jgi:glycosyltransferase involved in cell wall biosynthesis